MQGIASSLRAREDSRKAVGIVSPFWRRGPVAERFGRDEGSSPVS